MLSFLRSPPVLGQLTSVSFSALALDDLNDDVVVDPNQVSQQQADVSLAVVAPRRKNLLDMALSKELRIWGDQRHNVAEVELKTCILGDAFQRALLRRLVNQLAAAPLHLSDLADVKVIVVQVKKLLHLLHRWVIRVIG